MLEVKFHGRGGQGAVTAAEILAIAAFKNRKFSQAFPNFGPERTGSPVESYCRIDSKPILLRTHIYNPDYVVLLDPSLPKYIDITKGLKKNGILVLNREEPLDTKAKQYLVNATHIATEKLGKPIVNTAMLGALIKTTNVAKLENIIETIKERFPGEMGKKNAEAVKTAYEKTEVV